MSFPYYNHYARGHGYPQRSDLVLITPPSTEPVSTAEAKLQCEVTDSSHDTFIDGLVSAARKQVEDLECWIQLVTATYELRLDHFPLGCAPIVIPRPPLRTVESVKYIDEDGVLQTFGTSDNLSPEGILEYTVDTKSVHSPTNGEIWLNHGYSWPCARLEHNAVRVRLTCGFGSASEVPEPIKQWIKIMMATMFANREKEIVQQSNYSVELKFVDSLLDIYRVRAVR